MAINSRVGKVAKVGVVVTVLLVLLAIFLWLGTKYAESQKQIVQTRLTETVMTRESCPLPCWQGIVPGQTTNSQLLEFLKTKQKVDHTTPEESGGSIRQEFSWQDLSINIIGRAYVKDNRVQALSVRVLPGFQLTFGDLIQRYGAPEQVEPGAYLFGQEQAGAAIDFYYPQIGAAFASNAEAQSATGQAIVRPELAVVYIFLFPAGSIETMRATSMEWSGFSILFSYRQQEWHGFGEYEILRRTY